MSYKSSPYLVRLQELKLWQGNYDNLLQQSRSQNTIDCSDTDIEVVTPVKDSKLDPKVEYADKHDWCEWDKKAILPAKPFEELLEEKLAEDHDTRSSSGMKRPYLKKGSGLARYNLTHPIVLTPKNKKQVSKPTKKNLNKEIQVEQNIDEEQIGPTPLKAPEVNIRCKASWSKVTDEINENYDYISGNIIENINSHSFDDPSDNLQFERENVDTNHDQSEKELRLFELLEEKVDHTSFSTENSSIVRLLASTPRKTKINMEFKKPNHEVLTKLLENLKLLSQRNSDHYVTESPARKSDYDTTISEVEDETSNNNSRPQSASSFYTDFENTLGRPVKTDTGVNTSFVDKSESTQCLFTKCFNCIQLQNKIKNLDKEVPDILAEKSKLSDFAKELELKHKDLQQEIEFLKKKYERDIKDLQEELVMEKNKFAREKALVDMYLKESRPTKKEREETEMLKKELIDVKELMKMKETKNGTTQARLRNQIKQLEKENSELKSLLENTQKENAKLNATYKVKRDKDSKMLQEINKNLHRLTAETKQINKPEKIVTTEEKTRRKCRRKSMGDFKEKVEKELDMQLNKTENVPNNVNREEESEEDSCSVDVIYDKHLGISDIEKKYESAFGLYQENESYVKNVNESRKTDVLILSENIFSDGSKEIKYSTGSTKVISPNGKSTYMQYANGDVKETDLNKNIQKYYFLAKDTWLTRYSDGIEVVEFPNGQKETKYPDGKIEVVAADGKILISTPDGTQEIHYPDGSIMVTKEEEKIIYLSNGQKEIHNKDFKKREYPDGTVKIIYPDGTQESRYANGRVRIKDPDGNLKVDTYLNS